MMSNANRRFFDHRNNPVLLGARFAGGGEAEILHIANQPDQAAKIYTKSMPRGHGDKLQTMLYLEKHNPTYKLFDMTAWPKATLHESPGGPVRGFTMAKLGSFKEIHVLYSPAQRPAAFPAADWQFLVHTAKNCAAAFDEVHQHGMVIGDVNQGNVVVLDQARVCLLDCDSFGLRFNGQSFPCSAVGVDLFTPPELQGKPFSSVGRTANHDRFGLAVLIFYLLFINRHPFAGRYLRPGDMPIDQAIKEYRFAYGRAARNYLMQTPPRALPLSALSAELVELFERAFAPGSCQPNSRPTALQWMRALDVFSTSLKECTAYPGHVYYNKLTNCPWCGLLRQGARESELFASVACYRIGKRPPFDLSVVWARIEQVRRPSASYTRPGVVLSVTPRPWPANLGRAVPPKPNPPSILVSPPQPPVFTANLPLQPVQPSILTSPPAPPTIPIPRPKHERKVQEPESDQRFLASLAIICGVMFVPIGICAGILATVVSGRASAGVALLAILPLVIFLILGVGWVLLEIGRRRDEQKLNEQYDAEVAQLKAEAQRQLQIWQQRLAAQQAEPKRRYDDDMRQWRKKVAAAQAQVERQEMQWKAGLADQQAKARQEFEQAKGRWQVASDALQAEKTRRQQAVQEATRLTEIAEQKWFGVAAPFASEFDRRKSDLQILRDQHNRLVGEYAAERRALQARARDMQWNGFLRQAIIRDHKIPQIGAGLTATLASFGIETAFDIEESRILEVPGFAEGRTARLVEWRRMIETQFIFNPAAGLPPQELQALDARFARARQQVEAGLLAGENDLKTIAGRSEKELAELYEHIRSCLRLLAQASADLSAVPPGL